MIYLKILDYRIDYEDVSIEVCNSIEHAESIESVFKYSFNSPLMIGSFSLCSNDIVLASQIDVNGSDLDLKLSELQRDNFKSKLCRHSFNTIY